MSNKKKVKYIVNPPPDFSPQEIKDIRKNLDMTQATFAKVLGVSIKTIEAWESGTNIPLGTARRLLSMLKVDASILNKYDIISYK